MLHKQVILYSLENNDKEESLNKFSTHFYVWVFLISSWLIIWIRNNEYECLTVLHKWEVQIIQNYKFGRLRWLNISHFIMFIPFYSAASFFLSFSFLKVAFPLWKALSFSTFQVCYYDGTVYLFFLGISSLIRETGTAFSIYKKPFQEYLSLC